MDDYDCKYFKNKKSIIIDNNLALEYKKYCKEINTKEIENLIMIKSGVNNILLEKNQG